MPQEKFCFCLLNVKPISKVTIIYISTIYRKKVMRPIRQSKDYTFVDDFVLLFRCCLFHVLDFMTNLMPTAATVAIDQLLHTRCAIPTYNAPNQKLKNVGYNK